MSSRIEDADLAEAYEAALALEKAGDIAAAVAAYEKVLALDPEDHGGVSVRLAALQQAASPDKAPDAYVATLFGQQAHTFETILVDQLGYGVPGLIRQRVDVLMLGPFGHMLDIGCGTGLAGEAMQDVVSELTGFDLAEPMVDIAYDKEVYDSLYVCGFEDYLAENDEAPFDLIVAADVLPYLGVLDPLFSGAARNLAEEGLLVFSTERLPDEAAETHRVGPNQRFLHRTDYVVSALQAAGFGIVEVTDINVRQQDGEPSPGQLVIARLSPSG